MVMGDGVTKRYDDHVFEMNYMEITVTGCVRVFFVYLRKFTRSKKTILYLDDPSQTPKPKYECLRLPTLH